MVVSNISTNALNTSLRFYTLKKQNELAAVQKEVATGQKFDLGNSLGSFSSSVVSSKHQINQIDQLKITNSLAANRFSTMQIGMNSMIDSANKFISQMTVELNGSLDKQLLQSVGENALEEFTSSINVSIKGEFVFSGINTKSNAVVDYQNSSGAAAKSAVQNAFSTEFGFSVNDPSAQMISPTALKAFIDGPFMDLFDDTNWEALWSNSSDQGMVSKISTQEFITTSSTANAAAYRSFTAASVLVNEFSGGSLKLSALDSLALSAIEIMTSSVSEIAVEQAKVGTLEQRVSQADDRLEYQKNVLNNQLANLTDVDSYETAIRLNEIVVGLESSYAVTARIQSLSLLNYL